MGARLNGINYEKMHGLLEGTFGIKMMSRRNTLHLERKIRSSISDLCKIRQEENLAKHVLACKNLPGYKPIQWQHEGQSFSASPGPVSMDGAGKKRAYNHRITSDETAINVHSLVAKVPLTIVHSQVSVLLSCAISDS